MFQKRFHTASNGPTATYLPKNITLKPYETSLRKKSQNGACLRALGEGLGRLKKVIFITKFATHFDIFLCLHFRLVLIRQTGQHIEHALARARAGKLQTAWLKYPHPIFMEQAKGQLLAAYISVQ